MLKTQGEKVWLLQGIDSNQALFCGKEEESLGVKTRSQAHTPSPKPSHPSPTHQEHRGEAVWLNPSSHTPSSHQVTALEEFS